MSWLNCSGRVSRSPETRRRLIAGAITSAAISGAGYRARALTRGGMLASLMVGTAIATGTGWRGATVLGTFFVSSSALSRIARESDIAAKGSQRDAGQVLANGGIAALAGLGALVVGERRGLEILTGALAAAAADTWATEIGSTSRAMPRTLMHWRRVPPGTSGGVTIRGLAGGLGGATLLGLTATAVGRTRGPGVIVVPMLAGVAGSLVDSVVGELVQERRYCPSCEKATESRVHRCGTPTLHTGGVPGLDNDVVNLACTLTGAGIAALLARQPMARNA
jgi:uncharacterized protein (TIGR00297 family)